MMGRQGVPILDIRVLLVMTLTLLRRRAAVVERYSVISTFFRQQRPTPPRPRPSSYARQFHTTFSTHTAPQPEKPPPLPPNHNLDNYSRFFRRLALAVPHPHTPTRDDLLNVATGFWQRTRIRFKWFTIKSFRKFNADDMSAFFTWFLFSQTIWILIGT